MVYITQGSRVNTQCNQQGSSTSGGLLAVDLRNFLQLLRNHWKLIVLVTLMTTAGSVVLTARMTPMYSSSVTFYVSAQIKTSNDPIAAYEGSLLSQQEVQSYADLLTGPRLASHVVTSLGLPMSAAQLSTEISARPIPQTVLITATVTDSSASRAPPEGSRGPTCTSASCGGASPWISCP